MLGIYYHNPLWGKQYLFTVKENLVYLITGLIFTIPIIPCIRDRVDTKINEIGSFLAYGIGFLWAVSFLILGSHNPFIYFNF